MSDIKEMKDKATECAKECVDRLKNVDWKARGEQAKAKAKELASKENIDKVKAGIKSGVADLKTAEGRKRLKAATITGVATAKNKIIATWNSGPKGKVICVGAVALLLTIGLMTGDDEDFANGKLGDADDIMLSDKGFSTIFMNAGSPEADDGMIYQHRENASVQVLQSTSDGLLVGYVTGSNPFTSGLEDFFEKWGGSYDRIVFVTTDGDRYEEGQPLRGGYYVRSGTISYDGIDGGEHTVAHYVEITSEKEVAKIEHAITKREEAEQQSAIDAEGPAIEVDVPIRSLCGFTFGSTPSQNWNMFKENEGRLFTHRQSKNFSYKDSGTLVKPFRWFTKGEIEYSFESGAQECLQSVTLTSEDFDFDKVTVGSVIEEVGKVKNVIEKKFGIELIPGSGGDPGRRFSWHCGNNMCDEESLTLSFDSGRLYLNVHCWQVAKISKAIKAANKKSVALSDGEGADDL